MSFQSCRGATWRAIFGSRHSKQRSSSPKYPKMPMPPLIFALALILSSCKPSARPDEPQVAPAAVPPPPKVTDAPGPYSLRYFSAASGELVPVKTPADVPEGARTQVLVAPEDPNLQGPWLFVADLTKKNGESYEVVSVDRGALEQKVAAAHPKAEPAPVAAAPVAAAAAGKAAAGGDVVIYRTTWCGYCKKTAEYLKMKGVPFVEKDLEHDAGAREDMLARAKKVGVPESKLQGVPILSVKGHIITGFDRGAIDRALGG